MLLLCSLIRKELVNFIMMLINQIQIRRACHLLVVVKQYMRKLSYTSI
nr:MAG TPA: hypothetical protein [Bacteriophage sp.]